MVVAELTGDALVAQAFAAVVDEDVDEASVEDAFDEWSYRLSHNNGHTIGNGSDVKDELQSGSYPQRVDFVGRSWQYCWPMARTPKNHAAAKALGERLTVLHARYETRHGPTSFERIARQVEFQFSVTISGEHVRKYHRGENDPYAMNPVELAALGQFYGVGMSKLGKDVASIVETARDVLIHATGWLLGVTAAA